MPKWFKKLSIIALLSACTSACHNRVGTWGDNPQDTDIVRFSSGLSIPVMSRVVAGNRFYYVRMRIGGGPETNVILDTGSIGLRAIAAVVPHRDRDGKTNVYSFESGSELHGSVSNESVTVGQHQLGVIPIQVVDNLRCTVRVPNCPVARLDQSTPFAQGIDGRSNQEFGGILGIRLFAHDRVIPNPLRAAGIKRWVVQLPRRDGELGTLTLDTSLAELNGFSRMTVDKNGSISACLDGDDTRETQCLPTVLDSGDPHVFVYLSDVGNHVLAPGMAMKLVFTDTNNAAQKVMVKFTSAKNQMKPSRDLPRYDPALVSFKQLKEPGRTPYINSGYLPFISYVIYFDADERVIGLMARHS